MYKGGYSQVLNLCFYLELMQFLIKHQVIKPYTKVQTYLAICEQIIKVLTEETEKYESKLESYNTFYQDSTVSNGARSAVKYMKLEKSYI